ncbi:MAG: SDR family oxidoreductase [Betaproteobacteria bacterium]|nr:SDR family oxidoreductase [Betaproteobacteria bacterium]
MELNLNGRTALITGGSRGIGYATAQMLAAEGCHLHLASRSVADLKSARSKLAAAHRGNVSIHPLDMSVSANAVKLAKACGPVDILINNAGAIPQGTVTTMDEGTWRKAWDLKVFGFINLTREVYRDMCTRKRGVIVNVVGIGGERPTANYLAGSMANASLMAMSRALGAESVEYGVRVFAVNPGAIETDRSVVPFKTRAKAELGDENRWRELTTGFPFGRLGTAAELAAVIVFLASDRGSYVSGTVVTVDGGATGRNYVYPPFGGALDNAPEPNSARKTAARGKRG